MNPIIYNFSINSYISLIASLENKFNTYKKDLLNVDIILQHRSLNQQLNTHKLIYIQNTYKKEVQIFGSASNFFNCLKLINYHLISLSFLQNFKDVLSVPLIIEDYLIIKSFIDL